ncbi:hypothetical protein CHS0354_005279 [Potamilus streckersoni]|uniref:Uncharacterized protein n=1 Tax=Potamilus streckersoni TaxID=2493646 RepID=A0AAE0TB12_9BIVA|nr:hypothetical protein CHS0354_005279 [Potamilus streckersoni]
MHDMSRKCDLTIKFVQDEDNGEHGIESPISDSEMVDWEQHTEDTDQPNFPPETRRHDDINIGLLNQRTEIGRSDLSQKNGYDKVPSKNLNINNDQQPGKSQPRLSYKKGKFCSRRKLVVVAVVLFLVVVVLLAVKLYPHHVESSQPSVQALAGDAQIDVDQGKWIQGLCWKKDASCREPYCHYTHTDIAVLESLHQITQDKDWQYDKNGCPLVKCNEAHGCLECDQIKNEVEKIVYNCDHTLKCFHALTLMKECINSTGNRTNHIASLFCSDIEKHIMPKVQCSPGWVGDSCNQSSSRNITCKCYKLLSNSFCVNYTNCSEMTNLKNNVSLCKKYNLTHCLDESKVCRSQSMGGDQCLCDIEDKDLSIKTDIEEENGSGPDIRDLCWRTDAPCRKSYCNKTNHASPVPALERLHKIDQSHSSCHVKYYGQNYFNVSGNSNHQIASLICEDFESQSPPVFQCQQGWRGLRCNETNQRKIDCICFQSYSLCENNTDCSEMMYLDEKKSLCSKHNLTHCEFESHVCRTKIQGKECLCNVDTHLREDMKGQPGLVNGAAILGPFIGIPTRNSVAFVICLGLIYLHQSRGEDFTRIHETINFISLGFFSSHPYHGVKRE